MNSSTSTTTRERSQGLVAILNTFLNVWQMDFISDFFPSFIPSFERWLVCEWVSHLITIWGSSLSLCYKQAKHSSHSIFGGDVNPSATHTSHVCVCDMDPASMMMQTSSHRFAAWLGVSISLSPHPPVNWLLLKWWLTQGRKGNDGPLELNIVTVWRQNEPICFKMHPHRGSISTTFSRSSKFITMIAKKGRLTIKKVISIVTLNKKMNVWVWRRGKKNPRSLRDGWDSPQAFRHRQPARFLLFKSLHVDHKYYFIFLFHLFFSIFFYYVTICFCRVFFFTSVNESPIIIMDQ